MRPAALTFDAAGAKTALQLSSFGPRSTRVIETA
jgi:hypothetical protein